MPDAEAETQLSGGRRAPPGAAASNAGRGSEPGTRNTRFPGTRHQEGLTHGLEHRRLGPSSFKDRRLSSSRWRFLRDEVACEHSPIELPARERAALPRGGPEVVAQFQRTRSVPCRAPVFLSGPPVWWSSWWSGGGAARASRRVQLCLPWSSMPSNALACALS